MLGVTAVGTLLCASVSVKGGPKPIKVDYEIPAVLTPAEADRIGLAALFLTSCGEFTATVLSAPTAVCGKNFSERQQLIFPARTR